MTYEILRPDGGVHAVVDTAEDVMRRAWKGRGDKYDLAEIREAPIGVASEVHMFEREADWLPSVQYTARFRRLE